MYYEKVLSLLKGAGSKKVLKCKKIKRVIVCYMPQIWATEVHK